MHLTISLVLVLSLIGTCMGVRSQWAQLARADPAACVQVRLALRQFNLDLLESTLLDISNPTSPNYVGKWKTAEEVTSMVAPPKEVSAAVVAFLQERGRGANITVENYRDMVKMTAPVQFVEELVQTSLYLFQHKTRSSLMIFRAEGGYVIPDEIAMHVDFIAGLFEFPSVRTQASELVEYGVGVDGYVVPYVIRNLYGIPDVFPVNPNSSICLVEFQDDQSYSTKDLKKFATENAITETVVKHIVGPFSGGDPDAESTLDVQYGGAIALNTTVWFWTVKDWMYDFATDFLATPNPPKVVSMSWGWPEPLQCQVGNCTGDETSIQYVERTNVEFQKIGAIGVTLLAASGDQGAPGDSNPDCDKTGKKALSTIFPGASPWVLSVGATMLTNNSNVEIDDIAIDQLDLADLPPICATYECSTSTTELVCSYPKSLITTGGGFSSYSSVPSYQSSVVSAYLSSGIPLPPAADFNKSNRGFPDVSALGHNYLITLSGEDTQVDGTSCSSPVFAAIISLLNSYRLNNGKSPLGFVAPLLYQAYAADPSIFTDITSGDNKCTETCCAKEGYLATKSWDPVTGLGTPNFAKLLAYIQTLP